MSKLAKLRSKFSHTHTFNEAEVNRDAEGKFAPKDAAKQIASKTKRKKKISDKDKDFDALIEEVFQEQFKLYKENGSYKHIVFDDGKKYDDILKSQGIEAADKAYENFVRNSASDIATQLKKNAVIEDERASIAKSKDKQLKRELTAFDRLYPQHRYQLTLQEFKDKNPDANLLPRLETEEKIDKALSYDSTMKRGAKYTKKLDTSLSRAKTTDEKLKIMEEHRNELIKSGMSRQDAIGLVGSKKLDSSIVLRDDKEITSMSATEFYQITGGAGSSTLNTFKRDKPRAYASQHGRDINIGIFPESRTIFHEMGHHVEFEDNRIAAAARDWRDKRATGKEEPLNNLVKDANFDAHEKAKPGNYIHPYVGKVYSDGSTEVISMGIERFHSSESMLDFYEQDREHFQFIMGVIRRD